MAHGWTSVHNLLSRRWLKRFDLATLARAVLAPVLCRCAQGLILLVKSLPTSKEFWFVATFSLILAFNGAAAMDPGISQSHPDPVTLTVTGAPIIVALAGSSQVATFGGWTCDPETTTGPARREGTCPVCQEFKMDLTNHIRNARNCKDLADEFLDQLNLRRCPDCWKVFKKEGRHDCQRSTQQTDLDDYSQYEATQNIVETAQNDDFYEENPAADPAQSGDDDTDGPWLDHIPVPAPATPPPLAQVPPPIAQVPLPVATIAAGGVPTCAEDIQLEDLCRARGPRSVPGPKGPDNPWIKAVWRTAEVVLRAGQRFDEENRAWKLLLLMVKVCGGRLGLDSDEATETYPYLSEAQARIVKEKLLARLPEVPQDPESSRTRAVLRHFGRGEVGKADKVLVSDGIKELDADFRAQLAALHPDPLMPSIGMTNSSMF